MQQSALVLGASGRFGRNTMQAFRNSGWNVRAFDRKKDDLETVARGKDVIIYGWNPTYDRWQAEVPGQVKQVIAAARASGSTVLFPGNVYVYGSGSPANLSVETVHGATNPLGRIRIEMEEALRQSGVKTIVLRAGDFLDTEASGNWFDTIIAKNVAKGRISYPGDPHIPRAWTYLPDFAHAFVELAEIRHQLPEFSTLNYSGYTLSGSEIADVLRVQVRPMSWLPIRLLKPFWPVAKHLLEMRYLWNMPHYLDGSEFKQLLPEFRETPQDRALKTAASFKINPNKAMVGTRAAI